MGTVLIQNNFNRMTLHMLKQNARSKGAFKGQGFSDCAYRGAEGRRCGVGFLMADEHYKQSVEGHSVKCPAPWQVLYRSGAVSVPEPLMLKPSDMRYGVAGDGTWQEANLLGAVQHIHDTVPVDDWANALEQLAKLYGLTYPHALVNEMVTVEEVPAEQYAEGEEKCTLNA